MTGFEPNRISIAVAVSKMPNWRHVALVGIHELIEAVLCMDALVTDTRVTKFDEEFEKCRAAGREDRYATQFWFRNRLVPIDAEPGDQIDAPYYKQHQLATAVERMLAAELGVDWQEYEEANLELYKAPPPPPSKVEG